MKLPRDLKAGDVAKALCGDWGDRIVRRELHSPRVRSLRKR